MIEPEKLWQLNGGQRRRKLALTFGALERDIAGIAETGHEYSFKNLPRPEYTRRVVQLLLKDPELPPEAKKELEDLLSAPTFDERRICNCARNHLLAIIGSFPAEWDLVIAPHKKQDSLISRSISSTEASSQSTQSPGNSIEERAFFPGLYVYAEDIRSPFNLGSIFRTAEAFGAEKLYLSPFCTAPEHPRAVRSAMGCDKILPWERDSLDNIIAKLPEDTAVFSLETGGTDISEFVFPKKGLVIIGSEELGVSPEALSKSSLGCVTIPMKGIKASLNVGVAFGILMQAWTYSLKKQ
ncbi:MAG: TrmH family RNA methyltransferase [Treponemataceae bacterium]|nr:TrmH family RNA methyltransferase [Treponemataceae bacterium]